MGLSPAAVVCYSYLACKAVCHVYVCGPLLLAVREDAMMEKWRHAGPGGDASDRVFDAVGGRILGTKECIQNTETGEFREVFVAPGQTVGEAIENGQFTKD